MANAPVRRKGACKVLPWYLFAHDFHSFTVQCGERTGSTADNAQDIRVCSPDSSIGLGRVKLWGLCGSRQPFGVRMRIAWAACMHAICMHAMTSVDSCALSMRVSSVATHRQVWLASRRLSPGKSACHVPAPRREPGKCGSVCTACSGLRHEQDANPDPMSAEIVLQQTGA